MRVQLSQSKRREMDGCPFSGLGALPYTPSRRLHCSFTLFLGKACLPPLQDWLLNFPSFYNLLLCPSGSHVAPRLASSLSCNHMRSPQWVFSSPSRWFLNCPMDSVFLISKSEVFKTEAWDQTWVLLFSTIQPVLQTLNLSDPEHTMFDVKDFYFLSLSCWSTAMLSTRPGPKPCISLTHPFCFFF